MANTPRIGLLKKDSITEGNQTFNLKTMLNDNWDLIDALVALKSEIETPASVQQKIDTAIATLIEGAPGALNTLNELAAAMGDDPNFATTVLNRLATAEQDVAKRQVENNGYGVQTGLEVTASATPNMNVNVQPGTVYMPDGKRFAFTTATPITVSAADATNPRKDIVYVSSAGIISYLAGSPTATPAEPALPAGALHLYTIDLPAADTAIGQAQILDKKGAPKKKLSEVQEELTTHKADPVPHLFTDAADNKTYKYGFKTNVAKDGLVFVYQEVL
jgi:hypothetical protein